MYRDRCVLDVTLCFSYLFLAADERFTLKGECDYCRSVLVITNATKEDSGNYSCSATESQGRQVFMVEVKTNSTSGKLNVFSLSFFFTLSQKPIGWYSVEPCR